MTLSTPLYFRAAKRAAAFQHGVFDAVAADGLAVI